LKLGRHLAKVKNKPTLPRASDPVKDHVSFHDFVRCYLLSNVMLEERDIVSTSCLRLLFVVELIKTNSFKRKKEKGNIVHFLD